MSINFLDSSESFLVTICTTGIIHICYLLHKECAWYFVWPFGFILHLPPLSGKLIFLGCIKWEALAGSWGVGKVGLWYQYPWFPPSQASEAGGTCISLLKCADPPLVVATALSRGSRNYSFLFPARPIRSNSYKGAFSHPTGISDHRLVLPTSL